MKYDNIQKAVFLDRPNRFIARIRLDGAPETCHVKNTGRCRELLVPGAEIYVQRVQNPARKTAFDLIAVRKGERLINMDAAAPNAVFPEWAKDAGVFGQIALLRPETVHGDSRFDFYLESDLGPAFVEVKGVTLEENGVVRFPDAPTERGVKHLKGLAECVREGFHAHAVFVVQMADVRWFEPNRETHPAFADALLAAREAGVQLHAFSCRVTEDSITPLTPVKIKLKPQGV